MAGMKVFAIFFPDFLGNGIKKQGRVK